MSAVTGPPAVSATCHRRSDAIPVRVLGIALQISPNNLIKRVKRVAFGFSRFRNYRIRTLLYAGRPNWALLATITPR